MSRVDFGFIDVFFFFFNTVAGFDLFEILFENSTEENIFFPSLPQILLWFFRTQNRTASKMKGLSHLFLLDLMFSAAFVNLIFLLFIFN